MLLETRPPCRSSGSRPALQQCNSGAETNTTCGHNLWVCVCICIYIYICTCIYVVYFSGVCVCVCGHVHTCMLCTSRVYKHISHYRDVRSTRSNIDSGLSFYQVYYEACQGNVRPSWNLVAVRIVGVMHKRMETIVL